MSLGGQKAIVVDAGPALVVGVAANSANGEYGVSATLELVVTFTKAVTPTGTPTLLLATGVADAAATYVSGAGTTQLIFHYTVAAGDNASDLDYLSPSALVGTFNGADGVPADPTLPSPGAAGSLAANAALVLDTTAPVLLGVSSSSADGLYGLGATIDVRLTFSEGVTATGALTLLLETGALDRPAAYVSGSGTTTLVFSYAVQAGDDSPDLDYASTTALTGGTIVDAVGNLASLTLPVPGTSGSLAASKALIVDSTLPGVTGLDTLIANGSYPSGTLVDLTVTFSEAVVVTGTPTLSLDSGGTANYLSGSGTTTLTFRYTVGASDNVDDLDVLAIALGGGTIKSVANSKNATLLLPAAGASGSLSATHDLAIDNIAPVLQLVTSSKANGLYGLGTLIDVQVKFSEPVVVSGSPTLTLETGTVDQVVDYASGSGTDTLIFTYVVRAGDNTIDLDYASTTALVGSIADRAGLLPSLTLPAPGATGSLGASKALAIDTKSPTILGVSATNADATYDQGASISITVNFSEPVTTSDVPTIELETGATDRFAVYSSGSGTATLTFVYVVQAGDTSADLDYTLGGGLSGGTIYDLAGNATSLTLPQPGTAGSLGATKNLVIDGATPTVLAVDATSSDGSYGLGAGVDVTVKFSETVIVTGTPTLQLETGATDRMAVYSGGSGSDTLTFHYVVQPGDTSGDLDYVTTNSLSPAGGTIRDASAHDATLTLVAPGASGSLGAARAIVIDSVGPTVSSVGSNTGDGTYGAGTSIDVRVLFDEPVIVTGAPTLQLETGAVDRLATYVSTSGTTVVFSYQVQTGDTAADLEVLATTSLSVAAGTITDLAGNAATVTLPTLGGSSSLSGTRAIVIDSARPGIASITSAQANGSYKSGAALVLQVTFSQLVNVAGGTPTLTLNSGGAATYTGGSGTSTLSFAYTVGATDNAADLDVTALGLGGATIKSGTGSDATLTLPASGASGSLSFNKDLAIDNTKPTVSSVSSPDADTAYNSGDTLTITVTFNEKVTPTGTPTLALNSGGTASYVSGADTSTLTFSYLVADGQNASDLDYASTTALAGVIQDAAGNNATLTLPTPGASGSLGANKALIIDTVAPTILNVTSSRANAFYDVGALIDIQITFSSPVIVSGTPQLALAGMAGPALYQSGSSSATLTFLYTVQAGDASADLDYTSISALTGTIIDAASNPATRTLPAVGGAGSLGFNKALVIDTKLPNVTNVTATTNDGTYGVSKGIGITITFDEDVVVTGTPTLTLETGTTDHVATYISGSGGPTLSFGYTVQAGDTSADLDYVSTTALALAGGTIKDAAGHNAPRTLPSPGTDGSLGKNKNLILDTVAPTITGVTANPSSGVFDVNGTITISVNFSEAVTITAGTTTLALALGSTIRQVAYTSGSGTTSLNFLYTVQSGDNSPDLDYTAVGALSNPTGDFTDAAGNLAVTSLPLPGTAGSLSANSNLVISTTAPVVTNVTSSPASGSIAQGGSVNIAVTFDQNVYVVGLPQLLLETGATDRSATYTSGSGTKILSFTYTVQSGDTSTDLDYHDTGALTATGGATIKDASGRDANLTLATPTAAKSLSANSAIVIDGSVPTVTNVTSTTANGTYGLGVVIDLQVTFSEAVLVDTGSGAPFIGLAVGTTNGATYLSGSGTSTLVFRYTVAAGDGSAHLQYVYNFPPAGIIAGAGTIRDAAGNYANRTLPDVGGTGSLDVNRNIAIDTGPPTVTYVTAGIANGSYDVGAVIDVQVVFSENVIVNTAGGVPTLLLETGTTDRTAIYASGSGTSTLTFNYMVQSGDASADLQYASEGALALNGGTIKDTGVNNATLTLPSLSGGNPPPFTLAAYKNIAIVTAVPTVKNVVAATANGTYGAGALVDITVEFTKSVTVTGMPTLTLETGTTDRQAVYRSGSGSTILTFRYTVQATDSASDLDHTSTTALALAGGTIKDQGGQAATLTLPTPTAAGSLSANSAIVIDTTAPTVAAAGVTATPATGYFDSPQIVTLQVTLTEPVVVTGVPTLALETGTTNRAATYSGGSGTATLSFAYVVQPGDASDDLDYVGTGSLALAGGTMKDLAGNNLVRTLPAPGAPGSLGANAAIVIDTSQPVVQNITSSTANGTYGIGAVIDVRIRFSEPVFVTGSLILYLNSGPAIPCNVGSGTNLLTCSYTVGSNQNAPDLDYASPTALTGQSTYSIKDAAGHSADATLPAPSTSGSLGFNKNLVIDTTAPLVTGVTSTKADGTYGVGATIKIRVVFDEPVVVNTTGGSPTLKLETGSTDEIATYSAADSSGALVVFTYTVQPGDASPDLDYVPAGLVYNGATIKDVANNDASANPLPTPGAAGSLAANKAFVIETTAPTVVSVTSASADGVFKTGDVVPIQVVFSEAVNVTTGTPNLALATTPTARSADYASGSGTNTLVFNYTVQANDFSPDLDYASTGALAGSIADLAGNAAVPTLPTSGSCATSSLAALKNLAIVGNTLYPRPFYIAAPNWNDYVDTNATAEACGSTDTECTHGGELRRIVTNETTCAGLAMTDSFGAFDWTCKVVNTKAQFTSSFKVGKGLADLMGVGGLNLGHVTLTGCDGSSGTTCPATAPDVRWWTNPTATLPANATTSVATLTSACTLYHLDTDQTYGPYKLGANKQALVTLPGATLTSLDNASTSVILIDTSGSHVWLEGSFDGGASNAKKPARLIQLAARVSRTRNLDLVNAVSACVTIAGDGNRVEATTTSGAAISLEVSGDANTITQTTVLGSTLGLSVAGNTNAVRSLDIGCKGSAGTGIKLSGAASLNTIDDFRVGGCASGNNALTATGNRLSNGSFTNSATLTSSGGNVLTRLVFANNYGGSAKSIELGADDIATAITWANNYGRFDLSGSRTIVSNLAMANNAFDDTPTGAQGLYVRAGGATLSQVALARLFADLMADAKVTGNLLVFDGASCSTGGGSGFVGGTCALEGASDFTLTTGVSVDAAFVGKVATDDASNVSDTNGAASYASTLDWLRFVNDFRGWGREGGAFPALDQHGACTSGTCRIWDWRLLSAGTVIRNTTGNGSTQNAAFVANGACPTLTRAYVESATYSYSLTYAPGLNGLEVAGDGLGDDDGICEIGEVCVQRFLKNAIELVGDGAGDDDGLCEKNEACLYTPNFGAYQGEGSLSQCTYSSGPAPNVAGVTLWGYSTNGG